MIRSILQRTASARQSSALSCAATKCLWRPPNSSVSPIVQTLLVRMQSSNASAPRSKTVPKQKQYYQQQQQPAASTAESVIATGPDGTQYKIPLSFPLGKYTMQRYAPKIAPSIVQRRTAQLCVTVGKRKSIRGSPWRINLICQFLAGKTVPEALAQLHFVQKARAPLLYKVLKTTVDNAKIQHGLVPSQLEVVECFATPATPLKRLKIMGRGRSGRMTRKFTHVRMVLRQVDFPLKILASTSINQRLAWIEKMNVALEDARVYAIDRQEMESLERQVKQLEEKKKNKENKE